MGRMTTYTHTHAHTHLIVKIFGAIVDWHLSACRVGYTRVSGRVSLMDKRFEVVNSSTKNVGCEHVLLPKDLMRQRYACANISIINSRCQDFTCPRALTFLLVDTYSARERDRINETGVCFSRRRGSYVEQNIFHRVSTSQYGGGTSYTCNNPSVPKLTFPEIADVAQALVCKALVMDGVDCGDGDGVEVRQHL